MIFHHSGKYIRSFQIRFSTNLGLHRPLLLISLMVTTLITGDSDEFFFSRLFKTFAGPCQKSLSSFLVGSCRDWKVLRGLPSGAFTSPGIDTDVIWTLILSFIFNSCLNTIVPALLYRNFLPPPFFHVKSAPFRLNDWDFLSLRVASLKTTWVCFLNDLFADTRKPLQGAF